MSETRKIPKGIGESYYKPVVQIFPKGNTVVYKAMKDAHYITGINIRNILLCCENINKTAGGYKWRYCNESY